MRARTSVSLLQAFQQWWQVFRDGRPQDVEVDVEVVVHEPVAHASGFRPRDRGVAAPRLVAHLFRGLPTISTSFTSAKRSISFESRSARERPVANATALSPASIMWRMRISSGGVIKRSGRRPDLVAEVAAEILVRTELDLAAPEDRRQLELHPG